MMEHIRALNYVVVLGLLLSLIGCSASVRQDAEPNGLALDLQKAEAEKDDLIARMGAVTQTSDHLQKQLRTQLQKQVDGLTQSRTELQEQIDALAKSNAELQERIDGLVQSHDMAAAEAQKVQKRRDSLQSQLEAEAKTVCELRDHLAQIRELQGTIDKLQSELAQVVKYGSPISGSDTADSGNSGDSIGNVIEAPAKTN